MDNVMSLLYRSIGPFMLVAGLTTFYLMTDYLGMLVDTVKAEYEDNDTYSAGYVKGTVDEEDAISEGGKVTGQELKAFLANENPAGCVFVVDLGSGRKGTVSYSSTGYKVSGSFDSMKSLFTAIPDAQVFTASYNSSELSGYTQAKFSVLK